MKRDIDFVTKFMIDYDVVVPLSVIVGVVVLICGTIVFLFFHKSNLMEFIRNASWCLIAGYVFLALCATIFFRKETPEMRYSFQLFRCYSSIYYKMMAENILNILFFVPIGFLLGFAKRHNNTLQILSIGFGLSVTIEIIQLFTKRGVCNIVDVFHNTIGCLLGVGLYHICNWIINKYCIHIIHD